MQNGVVLIVEDDVLTRISIADHLRNCGFEILEADSGQAAVDMLMTGAQVDLVFTDVQMPGLVDGFGVEQWLREHRPGVPILMASGHEPALDLAEKLCGVRALFAKPYDEEQISAMIAHLLADKAAQAPAL